MIRPEIITLGVFLVVWGGIGFIIPMADNGWTASTFDQLCQTEVGQEEVSFSNPFGPCQVSRYLIINNFAYLGVGIGLIITGSVIKIF